MQKKKAKGDDKPATVKTHLRSMVIIPRMVASVCGVYNGMTFIQVEIKVTVALAGRVLCFIFSAICALA